MCGLWFSTGFEATRSVLDVISHRGPDGEGWTKVVGNWGSAQLGHRRLAIVDLNRRSDQPFCDATSRWQIVFNGQIYNHLELRAELEQIGHRFITTSDTEVLLHACIEWGRACLPRLEGMFAFVFLDTQSGAILAARDRFGIKPLYFAQKGRRLALASEIKQILAVDWVRRDIDRNTLTSFLSLGFLDHTNRTHFADVAQLRAGQFLEANLQNLTSLRIGRWYDPPFSPDLALDRRSVNDLSEEFRMHFDRAIDLHLRSDVQIGTCLSGGLDSSSIASSVAVQLRPDQINDFTAFTASFPGTSVNETDYARAVADSFSLPHVLVTPKPERFIEMISDIVWFQDEPFGSTSIFAQYCVFEAAKSAGIKVMLDGQGADEILAGYHWLFAPDLADQFRQGRFHKALSTLCERHRLYGLSKRKQLIRAGHFFIPEGMASMLRQVVGHHGLTRSRASSGRPTSFSAYPYWLSTTASLPALLHWEDRSSMTHSVEARVPFLYTPLAEFCMSLPRAHRFHEGLTKSLLRSSMSSRLPHKVAARTDKLGFATPENDWFASSLRGSILPLAEQAARRLPESIDVERLMDRARATAEGRATFTPELFRVLIAGVWAERFDVQ